METRKADPSDVTDEEWAFVAPYLTLMDPDAPQRRHDLRWIVRAGAPWRMLPTNFPPWAAVHQQTQRWIAAGCFEALVSGSAGAAAHGRGVRFAPHGRGARRPDPALDARERR